MKIHITTARKRRKWNKLQLARAAKTSPATITRLENTPREKLFPSAATIWRIADALGVDPVLLTYGRRVVEPVDVPDQEQAAS